MNPVTLQINLAPRDFRFAKYLLPHQIRQWAGQVSEILLVIESRRSRGPFGDGWEEGMKAILTLARSIPGARVIHVDYSASAQRTVIREFFQKTNRLPAKDYRGGPFYCYFFGLSQAAHDLVLHIDSDIFFGGGSQTWLAEAIELYASNPEVLIINPLGGPPPVSGRVEDSHDPRVIGLKQTPRGGPALAFDHLSTRAFLLDRTRFREKLGPIRVVSEFQSRPLLRLYRYFRNVSSAQLPEATLSNAMKARGMIRLDYLGHAPGMWEMHPPQPPFPGYFELLPQLVHRVETGDIPDGQRGYYNVNESMGGTPALPKIIHS